MKNQCVLYSKKEKIPSSFYTEEIVYSSRKDNSVQYKLVNTTQ